MRKIFYSFIFGILALVFLLSLVSAPAVNTGITLCGINYPCGTSDGVCPGNYGANCGNVFDVDCCVPSCSRPNGNILCSSTDTLDTCTIQCNSGYGNCDTNKFANGCEASLTTTSNCGSCGTQCTNTHGTTSCGSGVCNPICSSGWGNCDGNNANGCEASLTTTSKCGSCITQCTSPAICSLSGTTYSCCTPSSACAATACVGESCPDGCGGTVQGTKTPDCSGAGSYCSGTTYSSPNGCGTCTGTKLSDCGTRECGPVPNGCGTSCGTCVSGQDCISGTCQATPNAYWADEITGEISNIASVIPGSTNIKLALDNSRYTNPNEDVIFTIMEDDLLIDDIITTVTGNVNANGLVVAEWTIADLDKGKSLDDLSEDYTSMVFYFKVDDGQETERKSGDLTFTIVQPIDYCTTTISSCLDYPETECENNDCDVAANNNPSCGSDIPADECIYVCSWNSGTGECEPSSVTTLIPPAVCGNGIIESSETCDGTNFGIDPVTEGVRTAEDVCILYGLIGGSASCYPNTESDIEKRCHVDISGCEGVTPGGTCGDSELNIGEECDTGTWEGMIDCSTFDLFSWFGELNCDSKCLFDTSDCSRIIGGQEVSGVIGKCTYTESTNDACDDGWISFSWEASWAWDEGNPENYDPNGAQGKCADGKTTMKCPAQIRLPFFNIYNLIFTLTIILTIYTAMILRKNKFKKKLKYIKT